MSSIIQISTIPTLSDLYRNSRLKPPPAHAELFSPSASLNSRISLIRTDVTKLAATSIVNAANSSLLGGGGVDGAIHAAAGHDLYKECYTLDGCETGSAKITGGYELPCEHVIHAVGPIYSKAKRKGKDHPAELLRDCYKSSLNHAEAVGGSIAFACISTGVYGYPSEEAAIVATKEVRRWLEERDKEAMPEPREQGDKKAVERVIFCCFLEKDETAYQKWLPIVFPPTPSELPISPSNADKKATPDREVQPSKRLKPTTEVDSIPHRMAATTTTTTTAASASQDLDEKEWEAVEKPIAASLASSSLSTHPEASGEIEDPDTVDIDPATAAAAAKESAAKEKELKEEGVKVEAASLDEDEGVKVEKPTDPGSVIWKESGENTLAKDW